MNIEKMNNKETTLVHISNLIKKQTLEKLLEAEKLLESYINDNPRNIEMWLRLAVLELISPLVDEEKSIYCINHVFEIDSNNVDALLLFCCIHHFMLGDIDDELLNKLSNIKTDDKEKLSMIQYVKSWYYSRLDRENYHMYEKTLIKSIDLFPYHVHNCIDLAEFYIKNKQFPKAEELLKKALGNIKLIYPISNKDYTDVQEYFNEFLKGTHTTYLVVQNIENEITKLQNLDSEKWKYTKN